MDLVTFITSSRKAGCGCVLRSFKVIEIGSSPGSPYANYYYSRLLWRHTYLLWFIRLKFCRFYSLQSPINPFQQCSGISVWKLVSKNRKSMGCVMVNTTSLQSLVLTYCTQWCAGQTACSYGALYHSWAKPKVYWDRWVIKVMVSVCLPGIGNGSWRLGTVIDLLNVVLAWHLDTALLDWVELNRLPKQQHSACFTWAYMKDS